MQRVTTTAGISVSYDRTGSGPTLVLVHGAFSDHVTNWEFVLPLLEKHFEIVAIARRGRGETNATKGHALLDESRDVLAVIQAVGGPALLLGHSYGAHTALASAAMSPELVRKLVLYEPAWPSLLSEEAMAKLEDRARAGDWEDFAVRFFRDGLSVPIDELEELRKSALWPAILADAEATLGDLRALSQYDFDASRFRGVRCPVMLQVGTESPRNLYVTDALAAVLSDVRIEELSGQAHEGMTTAPVMYAESVTRFLLS